MFRDAEVLKLDHQKSDTALVQDGRSCRCGRWARQNFCSTKKVRAVATSKLRAGEGTIDAMNKPKHTPVPLPGFKKKSQSQETPSKAPLSREFINDSDDSGAEAAPKKTPAKEKSSKSKKKEPVQIAVHKPKTNGSAKKTPIPPPSKAAAEKPVAKQPEPESSSSEDSDEEDAKKSNGNAATSANQAGGDEDSSSSSSESSSDSEDEAAPSRPSHSADTQPAQQQSHTVEFRPVAPFVPPKGFVEQPTPRNATSEAVRILENLDGKEIWHITAPAGVSISHLKEVALDQALSGAAILSDKGVDYGFKAGEKSELGEREVLIPRANGYRAVSSRISRTLHLQQVVRLPKLPSQQVNAPTPKPRSITASSIRGPRPQVKGLKMRYVHSGFGDEEPGTIGSSDSEADVPATSAPGVPNGAPVLNKPGKRKVDDERSETPVKKHKKHRTPEEQKRHDEKKAKKKKDKVKSEV